MIVGAVVSWKVSVTALSLPVLTPSVSLEFLAWSRMKPSVTSMRSTLDVLSVCLTAAKPAVSSKLSFFVDVNVTVRTVGLVTTAVDMSDAVKDTSAAEVYP